MVFNSIDFLLFFPIVLIVYFVIPAKYRYIWLLVASYYFYMSWNPKYAVLILISTVITYLSGILLGKFGGEVGQKADSRKIKQKKNRIVANSFISNIGILFFFKYFDFAFDNLNRVLSLLHMEMIEKPFDVLLPVGISFYTFQALSYTMDVYRGDIKPEKNLLKYALFVSFFPQLVAGPIERSTNLMKQVQEVHTFKLWDYDNITNGAALMLWGYFMKMVVADRVAILADFVFGNYTQYGAAALILAAVFFAVQIYCDFNSYSLIAMGSAEIMGFNLIENFNTPYFSCSIKEFWRRWHISLSGWFRDYLYIPLGGNRKGKLRKYVNLLITFLVSGLWHGASFSFVAWGGLHGLYQVIGDFTLPFREKAVKKFRVNTHCFSYKLLRCWITFMLVDFAWIFFRCSSIKESIAYIRQIVTHVDPWSIFNGSLFTLGLSRIDFFVALLAIMILLIVDAVRYKKGMQLNAYLNTQSLWFRWGVYIFLVVAIFIFGIYGPSYDATQFYYFQF